MTISDLDERLIGLLQNNARLSTAELARRLGTARSTIQNRLEGLERRGVIRGYTAVVGSPYGSGRVRAHVMVKVDPKRGRTAESRLRGLPELEALYSVSGSYDLIALLQADSTEHIDQVLDQIRDMEGVAETRSAIILSTRFQR